MPRNLLCSLLTSGRKPETYSWQHTSRCPEPCSSSACLLEAANSQQSILKLLSQKPSSRQSTWRSWLRFSPLLGEQCLSKKQGDSRGHELLPHLAREQGRPALELSPPPQHLTAAIDCSSSPNLTNVEFLQFVFLLHFLKTGWFISFKLWPCWLLERGAQTPPQQAATSSCSGTEPGIAAAIRTYLQHSF